MNESQEVFKNSSTTYYYSSLFFQKKIFQQVRDLYAFVRIADNFVDQIPQDRKNLTLFINNTRACFQGKKMIANDHNLYIQRFVKLAKVKNFDLAWVEAFFHSMSSDLQKPKQWLIYQNEAELAKYVHGSAETIGLMMAKILELNEQAFVYARALGAAMQHINFIRDLKEDCELQRQYLPVSDLQKFQLKNFCSLNLGDETERKKIIALIRFEIKLYQAKQKFAERGYAYIPYLSLVPIKTTADLYQWTARRIAKQPLKVFEQKIKPSKLIVFLTLLKNVFLCLRY